MSTPINDGGQAFPCINPNFDGNWDRRGELHGMTLRDWFAGQALVGLLANPNTEVDPTIPGALVKLMQEGPFAIADAMLEARNKQPKP